MTGPSRSLRSPDRDAVPTLAPKLAAAVARSESRIADPFVDLARRYLEHEQAVYPDDDSGAEAYFAAQEHLEAELRATGPQSLGGAIIALHIVERHGRVFTLADIDLWLLDRVMDLLSREV